MEPLYKIVGPNGECLNGGHGTWSLPVGDRPGEWWDIDGDIRACVNGLHLAARDQVPHWMTHAPGTTVYRAETRGTLIDNGDKWVAQSARLLPRSKATPDLEPLRATLSRTTARRDRGLKRAAKLLDVTIPKVWRDYLDNVGSKLPAAHPGAVYQARLTAAKEAHRTAVDAAQVPYLTAQRAYDVAVREAVMPD